MNKNGWILYRNLAKNELLCQMLDLISRYHKIKGLEKANMTTEFTKNSAKFVKGAEWEGIMDELFECIRQLIELAEHCGFEGNLWHCFLTNLIINDENAFSLCCEQKGEPTGSIAEAVHQDFSFLKRLFDVNLQEMAEDLDVSELSLILQYQRDKRSAKMYNHRISGYICVLAKNLAHAQNAGEMKAIVSEFYQKFGVGKLGLHKSFRVIHDDDGVHIEPIRNIAHVKFDDLVGYEQAKKKLRDNTDAFVAGRPANNCLLFGDAGTGKSSCIKAMANEYFESGLRVIEIYKYQFQDLNAVISQIKNRGYRFVIYMDDLSFEEFETEYKYLKAVIEGGLEKKPENVLIYATSNRRHLIREQYSDKEDEDMHTGDTVQEKLSLAYRFGVTIYFGRPDKKEFQNIVKVLANRYRINMSEEELLLEANKWELSHGGLSGRTATQFIDYLRGSVQ